MKWEKLPKPWTKEQCRRRYVESEEDIGIRKLAVQAGLSKGTVEGWVRRELWVDQRRRYQDTLQTTIQVKTIHKTSERISDELSQIVIENYKVHKLTRDYVAKIIEQKARQLAEDLELTGEERKRAISQHSAPETNQWSQALQRSTNAINETRGIRYYVDINAATAMLAKEGYNVINPSEEEDTDEEL
jgi:histone H3/H4